MTTRNLTAARASLSELLDLVASGKEVTITRHGVPAAVLVRPDLLRGRLTPPILDATTEIERLLAAERASPTAPGGGLSSARAEALAAEVRLTRRRRSP